MSVDDRIVAIKFDNESFERKLSETIRSLDKLRASLDFSTSKKSLADLSKAGSNFHMDGLSRSIDGISNKFLALATIGITALSNITNKAVDAGIQMVKAFTFDPISDGFSEFETNMTSIQTILANTASKGSTLKDVEESLDVLNKYSDRTIYNFGEMAKNIGTFTAAGIDLETSVQSIKGIANLAAISGSNSQQASTAMYQLSQALAAGKVSLMDWNSVVNAGMGGEIFKKALFETGKALGEINDVPLGASFKEWEKQGGSFREQMQEGWITADVLKTTLSGLSGDVSSVSLQTRGFSKAAADALVATGKQGMEAATSVKTLTQLMSTVKEAVGTGWADTFRVVVGGFEESKKLFTDMNDTIGGFVSRQADARNQILLGWKAFGGRNNLLAAFKDGLSGIMTILKPISEAFREIFPKKTVADLINMTNAFGEFAGKIKIGAFTADKLGKLFKGFFAIIEIGFTVFKEVGKLIGRVVSAILDATHGLFDFASGSSGTLVALNEALVAGGGIADFFDRIGDIIVKAIRPLDAFIHKVIEFFESFSEQKGKVAEGTVQRIGERFEFFSAIVDRIKDIGGQIIDVLSEVFDVIVTWFKELGEKLVDAMVPGDFDKAVDLVNVGLLGGILLMLKKFATGGLKIDFGTGVLDKITGTLEGLTGTLQAMETNIKSEALIKIATAIAILTASVLVLSLIDSAKLTAALTATSVGFGQLIGTLTIITKLSSTASGVKFAVIAAGMILISVALLILAAAVKVMSSMDMDDLAKGLGGIGVGLGLLVGALNFMAGNTSGLIRAGLSLIGISIALLILSKAVKEFAEMDWGEMAKGLIGVGVALAILVGITNTIPKGSLIGVGLGLIGVSVALLILAKAVEAFAKIPMGSMVKGMLAIGIGLVIIAGAMHLMPATLPLTAVGLLLVSAALVIMAKAITMLADIGIGQLAAGVGALVIVLLALAIAVTVMQDAALGAVALVAVSGALLILANVLKILAEIPIAGLVTGLVAIAAVLLILGLAASIMQPILPALMGLGLAMLAVGAGFALFGAAVFLVAKGLILLAQGGKKGIEALVSMGKSLVAAIPGLIGAIITAVVEAITEIVDALPLLVKAIKVLVGHIIDTFTELIPKFVALVEAIMKGTFEVIGGLVPQLIELGFEILNALLTGIRENIGHLTDTAAEIMINFMNALEKKAPELAKAGINLLNTFLESIGAMGAEIAAAGYNLLIAFLSGIAENVMDILETVTLIITMFIQGITDSLLLIIDAGFQMLVSLLLGISNGIIEVANTVTNIIVSFITAIGDHYLEILAAGFNLLMSFLSGIGNNLIEVANAVGTIVSEFITAVGANSQLIIDAGVEALVNFITGLGEDLEDVIAAGTEVIIKFIEGIGDAASDITTAAFRTLLKFLKELDAAIVKYTPQLQEVGKSIAGHILDGLTFGLAGKAGGFLGAVEDLANDAKGVFNEKVDAHSPSRDFMKIGANIVLGLTMGIENDTSAEKASANLAGRVIDSFKNSIKRLPDALGVMEIDANPVIRPVLDLTQVRSEAKDLDGMFTNGIAPVVSIDRARAISATAQLQGEGATATQPVVQDIKFEQNIYAPESLSTNDIYRNTKSQIALAKEEFKIA